MTTLREAAQQALEALLDDCLVQVGPHSWERRSDLAITALRAALAEPPTNQCGETCERAKLCAVCARGLAEPAQEPVAWGVFEGENLHDFFTLREDAAQMAGYKGSHAVVAPLYAAPPQRKPLTDEEIDRITDAQWASNNHKPIYAAHRAYARAVEAAHGIKE